MRIFLSHKGADKVLVRNFSRTLKSLGFHPWLDEDDMPSGTSLERGLLQGLKDSCAAVFFITPNFRDEDFLATEVEHAIREERTRGDRFKIILIVFKGKGGIVGTVPELLKTKVWKTPKTQLEALREIVQKPSRSNSGRRFGGSALHAADQPMKRSDLGSGQDTTARRIYLTNAVNPMLLAAPLAATTPGRIVAFTIPLKGLARVIVTVCAMSS